MVQKVARFDDLTGEVATHTVPFSLDGVRYEIDLTTENVLDLRDRLQPYVEAATRTGGRMNRLGVERPPLSYVENRQRARRIREWAWAQGHEIAAYGRLPIEIVEAFEVARTASEK